MRQHGSDNNRNGNDDGALLTFIHMTVLIYLENCSLEAHQWQHQASIGFTMLTSLFWEKSETKKVATRAAHFYADKTTHTILRWLRRICTHRPDRDFFWPGHRPFKGAKRRRRYISIIYFFYGKCVRGKWCRALVDRNPNTHQPPDRWKKKF